MATGDILKPKRHGVGALSQSAPLYDRLFAEFGADFVSGFFGFGAFACIRVQQVAFAVGIARAAKLTDPNAKQAVGAFVTDLIEQAARGRLHRPVASGDRAIGVW